MFKTMTTQVSLYREGESPIFGEGTTHIKLADEAGGMFVILEQEGCELRFDFEEFAKIAEVVGQMRVDSKDDVLF